jgi:hypothetical protein
MLCQTQLVIVGATGMLGGYALKDPPVGSATSIGRELLSFAEATNKARCPWPGTQLNRRRQPSAALFRTNPVFNQQLNSSEWPINCDHSVTSADVGLSVGKKQRSVTRAPNDAQFFYSN